jgi:hypothetical protein
LCVTFVLSSNNLFFQAFASKVIDLLASLDWSGVPNPYAWCKIFITCGGLELWQFIKVCFVCGYFSSWIFYDIHHRWELWWYTDNEFRWYFEKNFDASHLCHNFSFVLNHLCVYAFNDPII